MKSYHLPRKGRMLKAALAVLLVMLTIFGMSETVLADKGGQGSQQELDQNYYNGTSYLFWDTMTSSGNTGSAKSEDRDKITSVTLNGLAVVQGNSTNVTSSLTSEKRLSDYFPDATTSYEQTGVALTITPIDGYYVTKVVVACCSQGTTSPFDCQTWNQGNAFTTDFNVSSGGSVTVNVSSKDFSHRSKSSRYFILIQLAPVPSPLYIEYDYGMIGEKIGSVSGTPFDSADGWTNETAGNNLGSQGTIDTDYTQYKYAYGDDPTEVTNWKHYSNTITDAAKSAAAEAGYYFAGWKVERYNTCSSADNTDGSYNNKIYTFSDQYGTDTGLYQEGVRISLGPNMKIIAQWEPIKMNVKKVVEGLPADSGDHTYTLQLQKQDSNGEWKNYGSSLQLTVNGNGGASQTISADSGQAIVPGVYRVVETDGNGTLTIGDSYYYCTVDNGENVTITSANVSETLIVKNSYSDEPVTTSITLTKQVTGELGDQAKTFTFSYQYEFEGKTTIGTETVQLAHGDSAVLSDIPIGAKLTITESDATGYSTTAKCGNTDLTVTGGKTDASKVIVLDTVTSDTKQIDVTNSKPYVPETGMNLTVLPYAILLVTVIVGGIALVIHRRRRV